MPHDLINAKPVIGGDQGVLRVQPAVAVHGPDQPALGSHAQAAALGPRAGRPDPRARRLRGARRAPHPLRPHLPDRDAGRSEHRPHRVALDLRPRQRVRLHRDAVPQGRRRPRSPTRSSSTRRCEEEKHTIAQANADTRQEGQVHRRTSSPPPRRRRSCMAQAARTSTSWTCRRTSWSRWPRR